MSPGLTLCPAWCTTRGGLSYTQPSEGFAVRQQFKTTPRLVAALLLGTSPVQLIFKAQLPIGSRARLGLNTSPPQGFTAQPHDLLSRGN